MLLGYNTNGLAYHSAQAAVELLGEIGYRSVALTIDHSLLNPYDTRLSDNLQEMRSLLKKHAMRSVVETGARYLLDPRVKYEPSLMSSSASRRTERVEFLKLAVDIAGELESDCVALHSGALRDDPGDSAALERLTDGLQQVAEYASDKKVTLGLEPEPGMFIDTLSHYQRLLEWFDAPHFRLTLNVGHLYCQGELPISDYIHRWKSRIVNVHVEDMRAGVHEHLMFGEGEMDFRPIINSLAEVGYDGAVHVELDRHSHAGADASRR
jgi:sugar phosphate isomerase/epimerase